MTQDALRTEAAEARLRLRRCLLAYYTGEGDPCPDGEYDALVKTLRALERAHPHLRDWDSPTTRVIPPALNPFPERRHSTPMLSLANVYSVAELREWEQSLRRLIPEEQPGYLAELKVDGLAIAVVYEAGRLVSAVTRGDGTVGEEVTRNIKTIPSLPHRLREPLSLEVRGEVYYTRANFDALNRERERQGEAPFKNPRNAAAGTLRMLDTTAVRQRRLDVAIYALASPSPRATASETLAWLGSLGLPVSDPVRRFTDLGEMEGYYQHWMTAREDLDFHIDGLVVKVDELELRDRIGFTSRSPRWAAALKFGAEQAETTLRQVEVGVGRTGRLTPVALLEPVELGGTTVSRATLHNYDQIERLGLMEGDRVILEKGGEIIPKVVAVVPPTAPAPERKAIAPPAECPSCGSAPVRLEGEVDYHCINPACPAQRADRIRHFVSRTAMDIESLGPVLIQQLLERGLIQTAADLFRLTAEALEPLERMGAKSARNVIEAIAASRARPLDKFLFALGIRYVGERTARIVARRFGTLEAVRAATMEDFEAVHEIGAVTAKSLYNFFKNPRNLELIDRCLERGVRPAPLSAGVGTAAPLRGKTVVITGTLTRPRTEWKERLESAGASVTGSVSKKTDYVLAGENPGSKLDAAGRLGVKVVDEGEMMRLLEPS